LGIPSFGETVRPKYGVKKRVAVGKNLKGMLNRVAYINSAIHACEVIILSESIGNTRLPPVVDADVSG